MVVQEGFIGGFEQKKKKKEKKKRWQKSDVDQYY